MMKKLVAILLLSVTATATATDDADYNVDNWLFDVYINDKRVGTHQFEVTDTGEQKTVVSEADFKVKFLIFTAFTYLHNNTERWSDDCLLEFDADTRYNDEQIAVSGTRVDGAFRVEKADAAQDLPECIMTFAYWNANFLNQDKLLNPQNGEYLDVSVERVGEDKLEVRGEAVAATKYQITAQDIDIRLWYSDDDQWLALESTAESGHIIRYELS